MKLLLSTLMTCVLVVVPAAADAKTRPAKATCVCVQTVEHRHGRTIVKTTTACRQKSRTPRLSNLNTWG